VISCVCRVYLVEGSYPELLVQLWDSYAKTGQSQNDRPGLIIHCHCHIVQFHTPACCMLQQNNFIFHHYVVLHLLFQDNWFICTDLLQFFMLLVQPSGVMNHFFLKNNYHYLYKKFGLHRISAFYQYFGSCSFNICQNWPFYLPCFALQSAAYQSLPDLYHLDCFLLQTYS